MAIEYRLMRANEMEQIFDLWVEVYPDTEREAWKREFLSIPDSREHTFVAVDNGRVLSTALLWIREMNDPAASVWRAGNVSHVTTHPNARRQGHAQQLLGLVLEEMRRRNCHVSTLFASEAAKPLYEKFLWRPYPLSFWEGRLVSADLPRSMEYVTRVAPRFEEPYLWETLSEIYREFNQARPFAIRRDHATWKSFTALKITDWVQAGASVWLAYTIQSPEIVCGYLLAHRGDQGFLIAEIGIKEEHRAAIPNLLYEVIGSYQERQGVGGRMYLPNEPDIRAFLQQCFQPLVQKESSELMVLTIVQEKDSGDLIVPLSQPAGIFWLLDQV